MSIDVMVYQKLNKLGKAKLHKLSDNLAVFICHRYDPATGERMPDSMEQLEIDVLVKTRDGLQDKVSVLNAIIDEVKTAPVLGQF